MTHEPELILQKHYGLKDFSLTQLGGGNINTTYRVDTNNTRYIFQRLHPIFDSRIHQHIQIVTQHLKNNEILTAELITTQDGQTHVCLVNEKKQEEKQNQEVWRLQTFIPGKMLESAENSKIVFNAAAHLRRFHQALSSLDYDYPFARKGIHNTEAHALKLKNILQMGLPDPTVNEEGKRLAEILLNFWEKIEAQTHLITKRVQAVHGDPKLANFLFDGEKAIALIDLDTLTQMPLHLEMGDALRSWCNKQDESREGASFSVDYFNAAMQGYFSAQNKAITQPPTKELNAFILGLIQISLELAIRFCSDVFEQNYFGWDNTKFNHAWQHHLRRAKNQWTLSQQVMQKRKELMQLLPL